jgi:hypothetical protein
VQLGFRHTLTGWVALAAAVFVAVLIALHGFRAVTAFAGVVLLLVVFTQFSGIDQRR